MQTVNQLLDAVKAKRQIPSDYKLAMYLGVAQATVQNWRHSRSLPDQRALERLAVELGMDPDVLILQVESQRAANESARLAWLRIAQRLQAGAAQLAVLVVVGLVSIVSTPSAHATVTSPAALKGGSLYIMLSKVWASFARGLRLRAIFAAFFGRNDVQSADTDAALFHAAG